MSGIDFKGKIGVEDINVGVGTFYRRTTTGEMIEMTKVQQIGDIGTEPPTTGEWIQGFIRWNSNPIAGGNVGWICVASGTPGTWQAWGTIDGGDFQWKDS